MNESSALRRSIAQIIYWADRCGADVVVPRLSVANILNVPEDSLPNRGAFALWEIIEIAQEYDCALRDVAETNNRRGASLALA
jgi:hypothetical protein